MIKIVATQDISEVALENLSRSLQSEFGTEVDHVGIGLLSAEPPSWITLLADLDWWVKGIGAYAALYVAELVKEAGKSTGRNLASKLVPEEHSKLEKLAEELATLKAQIADKTKLKIGLPFPNEYFSTSLTLSGTNSQAIAVEIGLFLHHLPKLKHLMKEEKLTESNVATGIFLELLSDGSLQVWWFDSDSLQKEVRNLSL